MYQIFPNQDNQLVCKQGPQKHLSFFFLKSIIYNMEYNGRLQQKYKVSIHPSTCCKCTYYTN